MSAHRMAAAIAVVLLVAVPAVRAADVNAGHQKAKEVCAACHGENGLSVTPDYPKLAGQHSDYLAKALRDYKSGARKNPIMAGFAAGLSQNDVENVAAYYASQPRAVFAKQH